MATPARPLESKHADAQDNVVGAEIWVGTSGDRLGALSRQCLSRRIAKRETLATAIERWTEERNQRRRGVDWHFTTADARIKLKRLYPSIGS